MKKEKEESNRGLGGDQTTAKRGHQWRSNGGRALVLPYSTHREIQGSEMHMEGEDWEVSTAGRERVYTQNKGTD